MFRCASHSIRWCILTKKYFVLKSKCEKCFYTSLSRVSFTFPACCDIIFIWWLSDCIIFGDCFGYSYSQPVLFRSIIIIRKISFPIIDIDQLRLLFFFLNYTTGYKIQVYWFEVKPVYLIRSFQHFLVNWRNHPWKSTDGFPSICSHKIWNFLCVPLKSGLYLNRF